MTRKPSSWPFYYGWVIVSIAFLSLGVWPAMRATFFVFLVVLLDEFHWSRASAAGVQSLSFVVYTCSAPLALARRVRLRCDRKLPDGISHRHRSVPPVLSVCVDRRAEKSAAGSKGSCRRPVSSALPECESR